MAMLETALALLLAHVLADFVFQTDWIMQRKRQAAGMALHIACVAALSLAALGGGVEAALAITLLHLVIDLIKTHALPDSLGSFLADQGAHLASIALVAAFLPGSAAAGLWGAHAQMLTPWALTLTGFILTVQAGGYAVGLLMARFASDAPADGLGQAGQLIGQLERALIFLMVMVGQPAGIGFLIAAKSVLRFDTTQNNQKASEYVIIGTLASFGWAMALSYGTLHALALLPS